MRVSTYVLSAALCMLAAGFPNSIQQGADVTVIVKPGVSSGNIIQVPVNVPVNVCGDTISVVGLLNPAFGSSCVNKKKRRDGGLHKRLLFGLGVVISDLEATIEVPEGVACR